MDEGAGGLKDSGADFVLIGLGEGRHVNGVHFEANTVHSQEPKGTRCTKHLGARQSEKRQL
jgi:hypothetical protein